MAMNKESISYVFSMAVVLCMACAIVVAGAAVSLRPAQEKNRLLDQRANVLQVVGLFERGMDVNAVFEDRIETMIIDIRTGEEVEGVDPREYDMFAAARKSGQNITLSGPEDIAGIGAIPKRAIVYVVRDDDGEVTNFIFPVNGYGLWSTMYGYVALEPDGDTIAGVTFYEHGETPGLGGEIDNRRWREQWVGKEVFDEQNEVAFRLVQGGADPDHDEHHHRIDGLSGATLTANGVNNMMRFWFSDRGYKPFIERNARS